MPDDLLKEDVNGSITEERRRAMNTMTLCDPSAPDFDIDPPFDASYARMRNLSRSIK